MRKKTDGLTYLLSVAGSILIGVGVTAGVLPEKVVEVEKTTTIQAPMEVPEGVPCPALYESEEDMAMYRLTALFADGGYRCEIADKENR